MNLSFSIFFLTRKIIVLLHIWKILRDISSRFFILFPMFIFIFELYWRKSFQICFKLKFCPSLDCLFVCFRFSSRVIFFPIFLYIVFCFLLSQSFIFGFLLSPELKKLSSYAFSMSLISPSNFLNFPSFFSTFFGWCMASSILSFCSCFYSFLVCLYDYHNSVVFMNCVYWKKYGSYRYFFPKTFLLSMFIHFLSSKL